MTVNIHEAKTNLSKLIAFLGKLKVDADLNSAIEANGFIELKISAICANATK